jgi:hypothetical protein
MRFERSGRELASDLFRFQLKSTNTLSQAVEAQVLLISLAICPVFQVNMNYLLLA